MHYTKAGESLKDLGTIADLYKVGKITDDVTEDESILVAVTTLYCRNFNKPASGIVESFSIYFILYILII